MVVKLLQFEKTKIPILVTLFGIVTEVKPLLWKRPLGKCVILLGINTDVNLLQR